MTSGRLVQQSLIWIALFALACSAAQAAGPTVTTMAGGYVGDGKLATLASLSNPVGLARDKSGNVYVSDALNCRIRKINSAGVILTFAGTGICGFSGDGGPARGAMLTNVYGIVLDQFGNLFISDASNSRIRKITPQGIIHTVAGSGSFGYSGDGGPATQASLSGPLSVSVDRRGQIYIADTGNNVIRLVDTAGIIHTVAGNGTSGFSGDGGPATSASFNFPWSVVADAQGNFYISDTNNQRVRKVDTSGIINTYAGDGQFGNTGSGGKANKAAIGAPSALYLANGKLYIGGSVVWAVNTQNQIINIIAGEPGFGFNGDGNTALNTIFSGTQGMALDNAGGLLVVDSGADRVRYVNSSQIVSTIAGGAVNDGSRATSASLNLSYQFSHISMDSGGNLYIADSADCRIRKVPPSGTITTIAGNGICGYSGDGGPATSAMLSVPEAAVADQNGNVFIADSGNSVIRKVDSTGTITTFLKYFTYPNGVESAFIPALAIDGAGNLYASDGFSVVWKVTPSGDTTIVAGVLFQLGYNGDGIPATEAWLTTPRGLAVDSAGNLYIADWFNNRIRKVDTSGMISTVAGNGTGGLSGDGGPATSAELNLPLDVAVDGNGRLYIADWINFRVRRVSAAGIIETVAGSGSLLYNGNGLPAKQTNMWPTSVAVSPVGTPYFADWYSYRVRKIQ